MTNSQQLYDGENTMKVDHRIRPIPVVLLGTLFAPNFHPNRTCTLTGFRPQKQLSVQVSFATKNALRQSLPFFEKGHICLGLFRPVPSHCQPSPDDAGLFRPFTPYLPAGIPDI